MKKEDSSSNRNNASKLEHKANKSKRLSKKSYLFCYISIIIIIGTLIGGLIWQFNIDQASDYEKVDLKIALITANDDYNKELYQKLDLDKYVTVERFKEKELTTTILNEFDIAIVSNVDLSNSTIGHIKSFLQSEQKSLIYLIDENSDGTDLVNLNITKTIKLEHFDGDNEVGYGICKETDEQEKLVSGIPWKTMPEIRNYTRLQGEDFYTGDAKESEVVLKDSADKNSGDIYLHYKNLKNGGKIYTFTIWFDEKVNKQEITDSWPYMGYFFYSMFMSLEDEPIPSYESWPHSPVPHFGEILIFALVFGSLGVGSFLIFIYAHKYSKEHPLKDVEALETEEEAQAKEDAREKIENLKKEQEPLDKTGVKKIKEITEKEDFSYEEIEGTLPDYLKGWNSVGLHRQIGGFWTVFFILLLLVLPGAGFFLWLFPTFVFPSPSGQGFYSFVVNFFGALWIFADLGTTIWMTRKFAAYRISNPKKAIASAQCFIWFQVLTGSFQIIGVGFIGAIGFPSTIYAHLTFVFVWYSIYQWLGFFLVFINILNSLQRVDVAGTGAAIIAPLFVVFQVVIVPIFIQWGANDPSIGIALGGAVGSSIANFVTYLGLFLVSRFVFQKTFGYKGNTIFRVDFDWDMFKDMLKFGIKYAPGQALVPLVWMLQVVLLSIYLDNYNNWLGYWNIAYTVIQVSAVIGLFSQSINPALSEALENDKHKLLNYDLSASVKWINNFNFWISAAMFAIIVPLILAITPEQFQPVAVLMPLLVLFQLLGPYSWLGDAVFAGMNHPLYATITWAVEQGARALLMIIFIPIFAGDPTIGIFSIMFAYIPALILKNIVVWMLIKKKVAPDFKVYPFKTFIAPAFAGICFYFVIFFVLFITGGGLIGAIIGAIIALVLGPFIFFFLSGLFGGWSYNGLEEFRRSVSIMSVAGKVSTGLYYCCKAGAKVSPWSEVGNIDSYKEARVEAWELTLAKKKLENF